jgi:hypothetical protein
MSAAAWQLQSTMILDQMGVERPVDNDNGICGVLKGKRVVVKCTGNDANSVLWAALAVADRDSVALIRNKIHADIQ